jgi:hypothetical protein
MRSIRPALRFTRISRHQTTHPVSITPRPSIFSARPITSRFYSEQTRQSESKSSPKSQENPEENQKQEEDPKKHHKEDTGPPPDPNKSPFQVFVDTFKSELSKSRELQESVKALQDESGKLGDSEALRRAKEAYAKARVPFSLIQRLMIGTI